MSSKPAPIARIVLGRGPGMAVEISAETAAEIGTPLVEIGGARDYLKHLTPAQADQLAAGLTLAARIARGEQPRPSALDDFLARL